MIISGSQKSLMPSSCNNNDLASFEGPVNSFALKDKARVHL